MSKDGFADWDLLGISTPYSKSFHLSGCLFFFILFLFFPGGTLGLQGLFTSCFKNGSRSYPKTKGIRCVSPSYLFRGSGPTKSGIRIPTIDTPDPNQPVVYSGVHIPWE